MNSHRICKSDFFEQLSRNVKFEVMRWIGLVGICGRNSRTDIQKLRAEREPYLLLLNVKQNAQQINSEQGVLNGLRQTFHDNGFDGTV
jgi:hypothetical protein